MHGVSCEGNPKTCLFEEILAELTVALLLSSRRGAYTSSNRKFRNFWNEINSCGKEKRIEDAFSSSMHNY